LIKKERLKSIRNFVEDGGFFPNSIIVNIDTNGRGLQFDLAQGQVKNAVSKIGVLHLPQKYRSVYIIDGQHRLYGYSESKYAETNSIPVVAFVDLQRKDQLKMFMEINENQKSVSRNLKNTLDPDIKWNSELLHERIDGLQKQIAQDFGEKTDSPLYQRVMVGEDGEKSDYKSITLQAIVIGLKGTNFFGSYSQSNTIIKDGTFFLGDNDRTYKVLIPFLFASFNHLEEIMPQEWQLTAKQGAILTVNSGITATIRLFDEILNHLILTKEINPKAMPTQKIMDEMKYYLDPLASYFDNLSESERKRIRSLYGAGAVTKVLRKLQMVINDVRADFNPEGLDEYRRDHSKQYNETSYKIVAKIEHFLSIKIRELLEKFYESRWLKDGVPRELQKELAARATEKNVEIDNPDDEKEPWDELYIIEYRKIVSYGKNWSTIFQNEFTRPHEANLRKDEKTKWIDKLSRIRNKLSHNDSVSLIEFEFLEGLRDWIQ
jgi:DNA sulfur modification protein DndB